MEMEALKTAMKTSISDVLEKMFFLPIDFSGNEGLGELWDLEKEEVLAIKMSFNGPFPGYMIFYIPKALALSLTASFLGNDEEGVLQDHVIETIKEITNMIAGNTFSTFNDQAVFNLSIPEHVPFNDVIANHSNNEKEILVPVTTLDSNLALQMVIG